MVKIVEKTKKEIEYEKKIKDLEKLAKDTLPFSVQIVSTNSGHFLVSGDDYPTETIFNVYTYMNKIVLDDKKYFEIALKLAEEYEKQTGENWTLKKDYSE